MFCKELLKFIDKLSMNSKEERNEILKKLNETKSKFYTADITIITGPDDMVNESTTIPGTNISDFIISEEDVDLEYLIDEIVFLEYSQNILLDKEPHECNFFTFTHYTFDCEEFDEGQSYVISKRGLINTCEQLGRYDLALKLVI